MQYATAICYFCLVRKWHHPSKTGRSLRAYSNRSSFFRRPFSFLPLYLCAAKFFAFLAIWSSFVVQLWVNTVVTEGFTQGGVSSFGPSSVWHCCSEPVKSAHLGCTLAYPPPADPDTLAPAVNGSALSVWCRPSLLPIETRVFSSNCLCGRVFVSVFVWEWYWPHDWRRLSFIVLWKTFYL